MKREFGFHDFRHTATSAIKRFTCLVTISSKANRYHRSVWLPVSAFIALHRHVLCRIWQKSGLNPTRDTHVRAWNGQVTSSDRIRHSVYGSFLMRYRPTHPAGNRSRGEWGKGEGRVIRHLPFHYCFRDTAAWHAISWSVSPLVRQSHGREIAPHYAHVDR